MAALLMAIPAALALGIGVAVWSRRPSYAVFPLGPIRLSGQPTAPYNVCVVMFSTPNIVPEYAGYAARVNFEYCRRHGYAFEHVVGTSSLEVPQWEKVRVVRDALQKHDAVFWIDSDAAFADHATPLDAWLMSAADVVGCTDVPNGPYSINTGTMLLKNTDWCRGFVDAWWAMRAEPKYAQWAYEQEALHDLITSDAMQCVSDGKVAIQPHDAFNSAYSEIVSGRRDTFVLHFMALPAEYRRKELLTLCQRVLSG